MNRNRLCKSAMGVVAAAAVSLSASVQAEGNYVMGTATTGGTYYPVGVAISTLIKVKLEPQTNISVSAISSAGSGENLKLMDEGQIQFGILQAFTAPTPGMAPARSPSLTKTCARSPCCGRTLSTS